MSDTPEQDEMWARFKDKGVVHFHIDAAPGSTPEQVAAEVNKVDRWLESPLNNLSSRLRGEAFIWCDSSHPKSEMRDGEFFQYPVTGEQKRAAQIAKLLEEAAEMIESFVPDNRTYHERLIDAVRIVYLDGCLNFHAACIKNGDTDTADPSWRLIEALLESFPEMLEEMRGKAGLSPSGEALNPPAKGGEDE